MWLLKKYSLSSNDNKHKNSKNKKANNHLASNFVFNETPVLKILWGKKKSLQD